MRKVRLYIATSLDGYIARTDHGLDWLPQGSPDQDYGYADFLAGIDILVMGRKTWEQVKSFGEWPYGQKKSYVLSRKLKELKDEHVSLVTEPVPQFISNLKKQTGKDIWLLGGGEIVKEFLAYDLIDTFEIFVVPILLGAGLPLFPAGFPERKLMLAGSKQFDSGLMLSYKRKAGKV